MHKILKDIDLPKNEILFLHVRLKGISDEVSYKLLSQEILKILTDLYQPKTILVPTFTYSFTKTGIYDRIDSPGEVGRFSEEIRKQYDPSQRTINPVFSVIDTQNYFRENNLKEESAFGEDALLHLLHELGHVVVNINAKEFISTYLHYLEYHFKVPYRYTKNFPGEVILSKKDKKIVNYQYYVRDLDKNTTWNREKIKYTLLEEGGLKNYIFDNFEVMWSHSKEMENILGSKLNADKNYLLKNG